MFRKLFLAAVTGALLVTVAWAGVGVAPVAPTGTSDLDVADGGLPTPARAPAAVGAGSALVTEPEDAATFLTPEDVAIPDVALDDGWYLAGAAKVNLYPNPEAYDGEWERDHDRCATLSESFFSELPESASHVVSAGSPWPENPNCLYMGGFGIGPMNPIVEFDDEYGLWVRSLALSDGDDALVLTVIDAEGWFWDYASKCDDCGWKQISQRLAGELQVDPSAFVFHATHSHAAMDFIGGWGFVPDWYMRQATDAIEESVRRAVAAMEPARLEVGEVTARPFNGERRDTYHAPEEQQLGWLRAYVPAGDERSGPQDPATRTIATVGTYAAHPTTKGTNDGIAHADWPGLFEARVEERFGGVGLHFMSGLGNMSARGGSAIGSALGDLVPEAGSGTTLATTDIRTAQRTWDQPTTNVPLTSLGAAGFFDRSFRQQPAQVSAGEDDASPCVSAAPVSVEVAASAALIGGQHVVTAGPGELFSNSTNTIKEKASSWFGGLALPIAQANDALGYLPESFEAGNPVSGQGAGFALSGPLYVEYEDAYAIDRCFGDMTLETTLGLLDAWRQD